MENIVIKPKLIFRQKTPDSSIWGKTICFLTNTNIYHVELILDESFISATAANGIYVKALKPINTKHYIVKDLEPIEITKEHYRKVWRFINSVADTEYDKLGLFWNQVIGISINNKKYFCSELAVEILTLLGYEEFMISPYLPSDFSPNDLFKYINNIENLEVKKYSIIGKIKRFFRWITKPFRRSK